MIKIVDIDALFDSYISNFVYENIGKVKPEEIENQMPILYKKFGDEKLNELGGKTPNEFYKEFSAKDLLSCLKQHLIKGVSVSDFLCEAIIQNKDSTSEITEQLKGENSEEYTIYLMNLLFDANGTPPFSRYIEFVTCNYSEAISEIATESLRAHADKVKENLISAYIEANTQVKERICDILSCASKDDRILNLLLLEFSVRQDNIPLFSAYISRYGDEKALSTLLTVIESEKISYADFEELRFAIESLGGSYDKVRDFSKDKSFIKIKGAKHKKN